MSIFGTNGKLGIDDSLDRDGEAEIFMESHGEQISDWVNKESAIQIITHLKCLFGI